MIIRDEHVTHDQRCEVRSTAANNRPSSIGGYAAVFGQEAVIAGAFREVIMPGAFTDALNRGDEVQALFNHDGLPLGTTHAKTLRLKQDDIGLYYEVDLPDTTDARDLAVSVARGDVRKSSFAFSVEDPAGDEQWDYSATKSGQLPLRKIKRVKLYDVSPVGRPAYEGTSVHARALDLVRVNAPVVAPVDTPDLAPPEPTYDADVLRMRIDLEEL